VVLLPLAAISTRIKAQEFAPWAGATPRDPAAMQAMPSSRRRSLAVATTAVAAAAAAASPFARASTVLAAVSASVAPGGRNMSGAAYQAIIIRPRTTRERGRRSTEETPAREPPKPKSHAC